MKKIMIVLTVSIVIVSTHTHAMLRSLQQISKGRQLPQRRSFAPGRDLESQKKIAENTIRTAQGTKELEDTIKSLEEKKERLHVYAQEDSFDRDDYTLAIRNLPWWKKLAPNFAKTVTDLQNQYRLADRAYFGTLNQLRNVKHDITNLSTILEKINKESMAKDTIISLQKREIQQLKEQLRLSQESPIQQTQQVKE